jgi:hypothetical protein
VLPVEVCYAWVGHTRLYIEQLLGGVEYLRAASANEQNIRARRISVAYDVCCLFSLACPPH